MSELLDRIDLRFDFITEKLSNHIVTESGCWEYQGYKQEGYGKFHIYVRDMRPRKRVFRATRIAYAYYHGVDPGPLLVCHKCDNPPCINPDHLFLGTDRDNTQDMIRKGRRACQTGENNPGSRLSELDVVEIVGLIRDGKTNIEIAEIMPVTHSLVSLIRLGKSWRHVTEKLDYNPEQYRRRAA